jgi:site-specific DNA-cytosine methylase
VSIYTAFFPFGGAGGGALGFQQAEFRMLGREARFQIVGGLDLDAAACADFEYLTGVPEACADVEQLQPADLRRIAGERAPDVVFMSPPCKGASGLLSQRRASTPKYQAMNDLALVWTRLMLASWAEPPRLVLLENVPRLKTRAGRMVREVRRLLNAAGYVCSDGFHDCGELGGLAQHRRRYLLVARHRRRVPPLLYQPPIRRVRACGDVLGPLPLPEDPAAGPMHRLPRISWLNWVRLALIPAGGDWRDLPGVLAEGEARRAKFKRHAMEDWDAAVGTVGGSGSNGVANVADPRIGMGACKPGAHHNKYRIERWDGPAHTVIGATRPGSGAPGIADPRTAWFPNVLGVTGWGTPTGVVTGQARPTTGAFSVADPRVKNAFDHGYMVLPWDAPSPTVAGKSHPGNGAYSVADPRLGCEPRAGAYGVLGWEEAAATVTGAARLDNGPWSVADPRKPPAQVPVIVAADGTWHRPLTTLELAILQGFPAEVRGAPLTLAGSASSAWRERIGNAVPPPAARAIAERMLAALLQADHEAFALSGDSAVWVRPEVAA